MPLEDGEDGLCDGEDEEEDGGGEGEEGPWAAEVGLHQVGPPDVPSPLAVGADLIVHLVEASVGIERHVLGEAVEQLRDRLVAADGVLDDPAVLQQLDVPGGVDDPVHEKDVGGDLVAGADVEALHSHEVTEHGLHQVVHHHLRQDEHAAPEKPPRN
ncbi:unnamed protein product [Spirodela intermedia]|uniref:Uncharacterized protein n=1 Tax=Spirodela intermedia TaxID=51605 RepID=A0A7I8JD81_SPIIN|nr:unnamed protein product [Spirodela intermedia]CAA6668126.1 unnamed protein product [Spirodela intermedia]